MKHIFILNPKAGIYDQTESLEHHFTSSNDDPSSERICYVTKHPMAAKEYAEEICQRYPDEELRFYACGGDGTLNEVLNGILNHPNAKLTSYPAGIGNDFIRTFATRNDFANLQRLIDGNTQTTDLMKVTIGKGKHQKIRYALNVVDMGFDAIIAHKMQCIKRNRLFGGYKSYKTALWLSGFAKKRYRCSISMDGEIIPLRRLMVCTLSNGRFFGGGFQCSPNSETNDGILELNILRPMSSLVMLRNLKMYRTGRHLETPFRDRYMVCRSGRIFEFIGSRALKMTIDGEVIKAKRVRVEVIPNALQFIVPSGLSNRL